MKKKRVLLVSCSVILLCVCVIAGMSYALFTDRVSVKNHLRAGNLDATLTRTNLKYNVLNKNGVLEEKIVEEDYDFTETTDENVFGINADDICIVPGSYFDAELQIKNNGNTAFTYSVTVELIGDSNDLAEQLKVVVIDHGGKKTEMKLSDLANGSSIDAGYIGVGDDAQTFSVRVEFIDDTSINNDAQSQTAVFDLVVEAVQATAQD